MCSGCDRNQLAWYECLIIFVVVTLLLVGVCCMVYLPSSAAVYRPEVGQWLIGTAVLVAVGYPLLKWIGENG